MKSLVTKIDKIESKNNLCTCKGEKGCECDLLNQLPSDIGVDQIRFNAKKVKENGQACNVNTTMNQLATGGNDELTGLIKK